MTTRAATNAAYNFSADIVIEAVQTHCHTDMLSQPTVRGNSLKVVQTQLLSGVLLAGCLFRLEVPVGTVTVLY